MDEQTHSLFIVREYCDFNTFHHSPRYAFALDYCSHHLCILIFQVSHKIASNILYIDSIDNALGIRFYLYVLRIHLHMYTLDWLPITVGTRTFQEGLLYNRSIVPIWRTSIFVKRMLISILYVVLSTPVVLFFLGYDTYIVYCIVWTTRQGELHSPYTQYVIFSITNS